jgi:transcriptional regulator with XRE-family HTH domain
MNSIYKPETVQKIDIVIGKRIARLRKQNNLSQKELALLCNTDASRIGKTERGVYGLQIRTLVLLADILNTDIETVLPIKELNALKKDIRRKSEDY